MCRSICGVTNACGFATGSHAEVCGHISETSESRNRKRWQCDGQRGKFRKHAFQSLTRPTLAVSRQYRSRGSPSDASPTPSTRNPTIVFADERPGLLFHARLLGIAVNVLYCAPNIVRHVEKDFPSWATPDGMRGNTLFRIKDGDLACLLKKDQHFLSLVAMSANAEMHVVRHDRASVARVLAGLDCRGK